MSAKRRPPREAAGAIAHYPVRRIPIAEMKPAPYNPRKIDAASQAALEQSLERFGMVETIVWNRRSGNVVGGNQRYKILKRRGVLHADVVEVDLDDLDERALCITLNNPSVQGTYDARLTALLESVRASRADLYERLRMARLELEDVGAVAGRSVDPDLVPETPAQPRTRPGDVIVLGRHRLACADSTTGGIALVLGDERVDSLVCDPPYGVDYAAKNKFLNTIDEGNRVQKAIANDARPEGDYRAWFASWLRLIPFAGYATFYVCMSGLELHTLRLAIDDVGFVCADYLVWVKNNHVLGRKDYDSRHEFVVYGWPKRHRFYADGHRTTVLEYDRPSVSDLASTMKPIALLQQLIKDGSPEGGLILDPFGGSGSTMIACEQAGRAARLVEIDPGLCDVIVRRWEGVTGKKAAWPTATPAASA